MLILSCILPVFVLVKCVTFATKIFPEKNMRIHVTHGKNRSDRYAILSKYALDIMTDYWFAYGKPTGYLFPKQHNPDKPIDTFYLSRNIHKHEEVLGWPKRITCHSFRHAK